MMAAFKELPQKMQELNVRMKSEHVSGTSSCGRVRVVVNCVGEVQTVSINDEGMDSNDTAQAVLEATNQASATAKQTYADSIREMVAGMNLDIPGIEGLLTSFTGG
ncbi:YbaB/EbfC family nucleoid-associated protein [Stieleria sp. TO1_6]|nr:YbaB/EbfC family nucleoid-associated protein [Stieleria tagensis]